MLVGLRDYEADTGVITAMDLSSQVGLRLITRKSHPTSRIKELNMKREHLLYDRGVSTFTI